MVNFFIQLPTIFAELAMENLALYPCRKRGIEKTANLANLNPLGKKRRILNGCRILIALLIISACSAFAGTNRNGPPFRANVLYFRDNDGQNALTKIWVEIPYYSYVFLKAGNVYEAKVEVAVIFDDATGFQMGGSTASDTLRTADVETALENGQTRLFYFRFRMAPGRYTMRVVINNEYGDKPLAGNVELNVPSFQEMKPQISSLVLASYAETPEEALINKHQRSIIPNVAHIFSSENPFCFLYFEIYNVTSTSPTDSFQVLCRLSRFGREVRSFTAKHPQTGAKAMVDMKLNLADLKPGEYLLTANLLDSSGKLKASTAAMFQLVAPDVIFSKMPEAMPQ
jgi:hypothetical protein